LHIKSRRIISNGGRVEPLNLEGEYVGPHRVWLRDEDTPGLCMSRSLGDEIAHSVGVLSEPDIELRNLRLDGTSCLILASDGIFEFLSNRDVMNVALEVAPDASLATERLIKLARAKWQKEEEDVIDDCTVTVVYISRGEANVPDEKVH